MGSSGRKFGLGQKYEILGKGPGDCVCGFVVRITHKWFSSVHDFALVTGLCLAETSDRAEREIDSMSYQAGGCAF